jgi:hypothetical protein
MMDYQDDYQKFVAARSSSTRAARQLNRPVSFTEDACGGLYTWTVSPDGSTTCTYTNRDF